VMPKFTVTIEAVKDKGRAANRMPKPRDRADLVVTLTKSAGSMLRIIGEIELRDNLTNLI
jgi:hypothetical protein